MYHACKGAAYAFRFKDWSDYRCTSEALGTAPSSGTAAIQLRKTYANGGFSTVRDITKPVSGTVTVFVNGVAKAGTLDTTTGRFTPTSAWSGGTLTWTGEFDVPVRFATDEMASTYDNFKLIQTTLDLEEVFGE
jgi:uncharacterized protein (TIGR02217 family)